MTRESEMTQEQATGRQVVSSMAHSKTHLADVDAPVRAVMLGCAYWTFSPEVQTYCERSVRDGVVMRPGTEVSCRACKIVDRYKAQATFSAPNMPEPRDGVDGFSAMRD